MELDAVWLPTEEEKRCKKERLCYNCRKPDHMAQDCRSRKNDKEPQQLRATREKGIYDTTGTPTIQRLCATQERKTAVDE